MLVAGHEFTRLCHEQRTAVWVCNNMAKLRRTKEKFAAAELPLEVKNADKETATKKITPVIALPKDNRVRVMPLGGLGEIGMNITLFAYNKVMFAVDCGQMLPDEEQLGVDMVIPDYEFIEQHRNIFCGVVLTHAHEDHIGALPYLLQRFDVPVYGSRLTIEIVRARLKEYGLAATADLRIVEAGETIQFDKVSIEFISVTHSIMGAMAVAIHTPIGTLIQTGDYKIDPTPIGGEGFDYHTFAKLGAGGKVLALLADSTNVNVEGHSKSEQSVIEPINRLFEQAKGKIIFSAFSSSLHRVQVVINAAKKYNRNVVLYGLNMVRNVRIAASLGMLEDANEVIIDSNRARNMPPDRLVLLCTGSQGEPLSALNRLALGEHSDFSVTKGDMVVLSSRFIPGNEKAVYRMINNLYKRGADVHYERNTPGIHVSGHAAREEMRLMMKLCAPKYLVPMHGETRHLMEHAKLGMSMGIPRTNVLVMSNGNMLVMSAKGIERGPDVPCGRVLVDGRADIGGVSEVVLRDRHELANDGMMIVMMVVDRATGELMNDPDIVSRGFLFMDEHEDFFELCKKVVEETFNASRIESRGEWNVVKMTMRRALRKFVKAKTGRYPVILPVVMEV